MVRISKEEILARFPMEKHGEFMARAIANSFKAGIDGIIYGTTVADSKKYGNFDDDLIYYQLKKPVAERFISEQSIMRPEAVEVWKQYSKRKNKVDY